jgi:hypothetical protein
MAGIREFSVIHTMNKIILLLGIVLIIFGGGIIIEPSYKHVTSGYHFDFSDHNIPFGIFIIVVGILILGTSLNKINKDNKNKYVK